MRVRRRSGRTLLEVVIGTGCLLGVIAGGFAVTNTSNELAASSAADDVASRRVDRVLRATAAEIRQASLATLLRTDGSAFATGTSANGFQCRRVLGYEGEVLLDATSSVTLQMSGSEGTVLLTQGGVQEVVANGIRSLTVSRAGDTFTVSVEAHAGPNDDSGRSASGSVTVRSRNP